MKNFLVFVLVLITAFSAYGQDINTYLENANAAFNAGKYENAVKNFTAYQNSRGNAGQDVSQRIKDSEDCKNALSMADDYFSNGDYKNAAIQYSKVTRLNQNDTYAKNRYDFCMEQARNQEDNKIQVENKTGKIKSPKDNVIGGRNFSLGITAGIVSENFKVSTSGNYIGSAIDYGYGDDSEKPAYKSEMGFSVGLLLDIRLDKNLYLQPSINYVNAKVKNSFSSSSPYRLDNYTATTYLTGTVYDDFDENYELNYIEVPILLSYRFKLSEKSNIQINAGPYVGYGISGKGKVTGSTDWPLLTEYYYSNSAATGQTYLINSNTEGNLDLFGKAGHSTTTYTTGDAPTNTYDYTFKEAPFKNLDAGVRFGAGFEFSGFIIGVSYDLGLLNIANDEYWSSERMNISDYRGNAKMEGYQQKLNKLQVQIGYIFRW